MAEISEEMKAVIQVTAEAVVREALKNFRCEMNTVIDLHSARCQASRLGAFKGTVIAVVSGIAVLVGNYIKEKLMGN